MKITNNVIKLDCTRGAYAYAVLHDGVTLIDTSYPGRGGRILKELASHGIKPHDIRRILLTHSDPDHIGSAAYIKERAGCGVFIAEAELEFILRRKRTRGLKDLLGFLPGVRFPDFAKPFDVDCFGGITVIPTPVHTPGHTSFRFENVFFAGDCLSSSRNMMKSFPRPHRLDREKTVAFLKGLGLSGVEWVCTGHSELLHLD